MLVRFVLVCCLSAEPTRCVEQRPLPAAPEAGLTACLVAAQPEAARRLATRPDRVLARYRCGIGSGRPRERRA